MTPSRPGDVHSRPARRLGFEPCGAVESASHSRGSVVEQGQNRSISRLDVVVAAVCVALVIALESLLPGRFSLVDWEHLIVAVRVPLVAAFVMVRPEFRWMVALLAPAAAVSGEVLLGAAAMGCDSSDQRTSGSSRTGGVLPIVHRCGGSHLSSASKLAVAFGTVVAVLVGHDNDGLSDAAHLHRRGRLRLASWP